MSRHDRPAGGATNIAIVTTAYRVVQTIAAGARSPSASCRVRLIWVIYIMIIECVIVRLALLFRALLNTQCDGTQCRQPQPPPNGKLLLELKTLPHVTISLTISLTMPVFSIVDDIVDEIVTCGRAFRPGEVVVGRDQAR